MIAARTLAWSIWQRNSRWLILIAGYFVFYGLVIVRLNGTDNHPTLFAVASVFLIFCYLALTGIFMYQDTDVGVRGSAYPTHMFTLPLRTYQLVFVPMLTGTVVFLSSGLAITKLIHGYYPDFPVFWPVMLVTATLAMLQALFWYPLGVPYSKLVLTLIGLPTLVYYVCMPLADKVSELIVCEYLGLVILSCYAIAYHGVAMARQGKIQLFSLKPKITPARIHKQSKWLKFSSPAAAQRWYEWRQQGLILPCLVLFCCSIFSVEMFRERGYVGPVTAQGPNKDGLYPMVWPMISAYAPLLVFLVPVIALIVGCGARRTDIKHSDRTFLLFFGARPMSDGGLVAQKLWMALKSSLVAWGIILVQFMAMLPIRAAVWDAKTQVIVDQDTTIFRMLVSYLNPQFIALTLSFIFVVILLTWRNFIIGFWTELSGKTWLRYGYPIGSIALYIGVDVFLTRRSPGGQPIGPNFEQTVMIIWAINVLRAILATTLIWRQLRSGVLTPRTLLRGAILGSLLLASLMVAVWFYTGSNRPEIATIYHSSPNFAGSLVIGLTVLWTPIVRILMATEMLHQNRHRAT